MQAGLTGTGECDFFGADGVLANEHFDTLTSILEDYKAEQARVCHGAELPHRRRRALRASTARTTSPVTGTTTCRDRRRPQRSPGSPSPRCWSCDDLRPAGAVLSTSEYRENPVGEADPGF